MVDLRRCTHGVGSMSEEDALKNWLCRWSIVPYTSSVAVQWMPSLMAVQVQGNTMGSESVQLVGSGCTFREALTWRWRLSTQSIGDRVIDGHVLGTQELNEVSEEFRLKLASSVCRDGWKGAKQVIQPEFLGPYERALTGSAPSCKAYVLHICSFTDHFVLQMVVFDWYRAWGSSKSSFIMVKWNLDYFAGLKQSFFAEHFTNSLIYRTEYSIRNIQVVCSITIKRANVWAVHLSIRIATS